jgi:aldose sugar dehydrogenase
MIPFKKASKALLFMTLLLNVFIIVLYYPYYNNNNYFSTKALSHPITVQSPQGPIIKDPKLKAEVVFRGLNFPTSMAFLGPNDILVLEKNDGTVRRIVNGTMLSNPVLHVNVDNKGERGMLGIALTRIKNSANAQPITFVFLYFTEADDGIKTSANNSSVSTEQHHQNQPFVNRVYRYELVNNNEKLVNPKLLLSLPAFPGSAHNGGRLIIGPDNNIYLVIGDVNGDTNYSNATTLAENIEARPSPDGRGGILRITQDGKPVGNGILGDKFPLNLYYAYGIRNSFGIDFDPITKKLWDTENGPRYGDEINLVDPGFNSGWMQVQGIWEPDGPRAGDTILDPEGYLVNFQGKGKYSPPEFTWYSPQVGPTGIKFLNSNKLGKQYQDDIFVGDFHLGNLYHFKLNQSRTGLALDVPLASKIAANGTDNAVVQSIIFGHGFGGITDVQVGPDGYLYILSLYEGGDNCDPIHPRPCIQYESSLLGTIFRIAPISTLQPPVQHDLNKN